MSIQSDENPEQAISIIPIPAERAQYADPGLPIQEDIIRSFLGSYSRDPFQRQLAKLLACSPDHESIKKFANRNPDRWARCVQIFASLAGYTEKIEVEHNFNIDSMSDAEVERRLAELEGLLRGTDTVNIEPVRGTVTIEQADQGEGTVT